MLLVVIAVLGVSYASSIRAWLNQRSDENTLSAQIATQRQTIAELQTAKRRWNDPAYIEEQARLRFGWVLPGERSYRVIGRDGKVLSTSTSELDTSVPGQTSAHPPWWDGVVGSFTQADAVPKPHPSTAPTRQPARIIGPAGANSGH